MHYGFCPVIPEGLTATQCLQMFYGLSKKFLRTPLKYPSVALTPLSPILEFQRRVIQIGARLWINLFNWKKDWTTMSSAETLYVVVRSCWSFFYKCNLYFRNREHYIFDILCKTIFFQLFCPMRESNPPNGAKVYSYIFWCPGMAIDFVCVLLKN